ncbi:hypothetical protein [Lapidilactobacillus salsurivasis]
MLGRAIEPIKLVDLFKKMGLEFLVLENDSSPGILDFFDAKKSIYASHTGKDGQRQQLSVTLETSIHAVLDFWFDMTISMLLNSAIVVVTELGLTEKRRTICLTLRDNEPEFE